MRTASFLVGALVAAALAGCLERSTLPSTGNDVDELVNRLDGYVNPFILDHDHSVAKNHDLAFHIKQLAHDPLGGNRLKSSGAHAVDVRGSWLFVAAYGFTVDVDGGVYIFDLANPEQPKRTGVFRLPGALGGDRSMEATADANWVVLGTEAMTCANHVNPFAPGLYLIDARDKANPKIADYRPARGVHSVSVHRVGGKDYAVTAGGTDTTNGQNVWSLEGGRLTPVGTVKVAHDTAIYDDPVLGKPILYVADVSDLDVYDFSDPTKPQRLGTWTPPDNKNHYVHAVTMDLVEGRRILVLESEDWKDRPSPLWVLDSTEFDTIQLLATHLNPAGAPAHAGQGVSLGFSTHNPRLEKGIAYVAHYHAGVWMFDVRTMEKAKAPEIMGYFLPHEDNGGYRPQSSSSALPAPSNPACTAFVGGELKLLELPNTMDVEVKDGIVYAADLHTGLYTLKYDASVLPKIA